MTPSAAEAARPARVRGRWIEIGELVFLAALAYVPFLFSSRGRLSADTKEYLYLDPGRLLERALYLWDPHVAAGTVPHQQVGYLFPMGLYYWVADLVGVPDWIAQRLWLGTISLVAALGARWLFNLLGTGRVGALAGALVYMLTPYQLAFTARISVILLPWAALPWLVGLTIRATRRGGWRDPVLFALVILTVGGVNASALVLVGVAPALWIVLELLRGRDAAWAALRAVGRIAVLSIGVSLWWIVGLRLQGVYGLPVLQLTENVQTVTEYSTPSDLLRGLGNWFFYGADRLGYAIDQAWDYARDTNTVVASFAVPVVALLAAAMIRWRYRVYFALLLVVGVIIGTGAWPYDDPSPYGRLWKSFANDSSLGLALRNTPRVAPVIVLACAGLLAAAVGSLADYKRQVVAGVLVGALALAALLPVWNTGFLSDSVSAPNEVPSYWTEAARALDRDGHATRVFEIPGSNFAAYRWGNTVEPITPGLMDRPYLAREVLPYGSFQTVNLLDALDRRMQEGTFEPAAIAPVARLFAVGTIALRSDLQYERYDTPKPRELWKDLTDPLAPGLRPPVSFGPRVANLAFPPVIDERDLNSAAGRADPPPVALFAVKDTVPIVHAAPSRKPVVLAGDGDGIVDAAGAGLLDGKSLVLELASLTDAQLRQALRADADLVLTDSNRRRIQNWFSSLQGTKGATEPAGQTAPDPNEYDFRLDVFPGAGDASRTVVEQRGGEVDATGDGGAPRPEDRPVYAFDGDLRTSWRVGGADVSEQRIVLRTDHPVRANHVTIVQPLDGPRDRVLTTVRLRFDHGPPVVVDLGEASLTPEGQVVRFPVRTVRRLEIDLLATSTPAIDPALANAVGFAEVRLDDVTVQETVRLPVDLARRVDRAADGHKLAVVMSRLRVDPASRGRQDEELALDRRFVIPDARTFLLTGTARVDPNAADPVLDGVFGTTVPDTVFNASSHLRGDANARASRAFDDDPATAWSPALGAQEGQWIDADLAAPLTVDHVDLTVVADGRHSVPTRLRLDADGAPAHTLEVPAVADRTEGDATHTVRIPFAPVTARNLRLTVDAVRRATAAPGDPDNARTLPVAIVEAGFDGLPVLPAPRISTQCRNDLITVDGRAEPVRLEGSVADARSGMSIVECGPPLALRAGSHRLQSSAGMDTGIDVDRVVLTSGARGQAVPVMPLGAPISTSGATVRVEDSASTALDLKVRTDGRPFWLVLSESHNDGWQAKTSSGSLGEPTVVNGYANGWLVRPTGPGTMSVQLRWTPQRLVWIGFALSALAVAGCAVILIVSARRRRRREGEDDGVLEIPTLVSPLTFTWGAPPSWTTTALLALGAGLATAFVSRPWIGLLAAAGALITLRVSYTRWLLTLTAPVLLALSRSYEQPELAWLAVALFATDVGCGVARSRAQRAAQEPANSSAQGTDSVPHTLEHGG